MNKPRAFLLFTLFAIANTSNHVRVNRTQEPQSNDNRTPSETNNAPMSAIETIIGLDACIRAMNDVRRPFINMITSGPNAIALVSDLNSTIRNTMYWQEIRTNQQNDQNNNNINPNQIARDIVSRYRVLHTRNSPEARTNQQNDNNRTQNRINDVSQENSNNEGQDIKNTKYIIEKCAKCSKHFNDEEEVIKQCSSKKMFHATCINESKDTKNIKYFIEKCSICLEKFEEEEVIAELGKCKHKFHTKCVLPWLKEHGSCPNCRKTTVWSPPKK